MEKWHSTQCKSQFLDEEVSLNLYDGFKEKVGEEILLNESILYRTRRIWAKHILRGNLEAVHSQLEKKHERG